MAQATIATTVTGLQGHPVSNVAPATVGQLLTWNGSAWAPDNTTYMPVAGGTFTGPITLSGAATEANQPATLTQVATAAGVNIGRNFIHNPQFFWNQRGSSSYGGTVAAGSYTVDRWAQFLGAAGDSQTITQAGASDADRAAIGDESAVFYVSAAFAGGAGASNVVQYWQRIEDVRRLGNKTCTLSFWAYSPTSLRLGLAYTQFFGSGGSPSASVNGNIGNVQLTTGWTRYTLTFTMPSTAGQTLGTTAFSTFTTIYFFLSAPPANTLYYPLSGNLGAQTGTINIWGVQLEIGSQATPFEHRDPETELALCQRFFINNSNPGTFSGYAASTAAMIVPGIFPYAVTMRLIPTVTLGISNTSNVTGTPSVQISANWGMSIVLTPTAAGGYSIGNISYAASADL